MIAESPFKWYYMGESPLLSAPLVVLSTDDSPYVVQSRMAQRVRDAFCSALRRSRFRDDLRCELLIRFAIGSGDDFLGNEQQHWQHQCIHYCDGDDAINESVFRAGFVNPCAQ